MRLYHGVNDNHEFWESEDRSLILFRNHHEKFWSANRNYDFLWSESTLRRAVKRLGCTLDNYKAWRQKRAGKFKNGRPKIVFELEEA